MDNFPYALRHIGIWLKTEGFPVAEWKQGGNRNQRHEEVI
jgi:hypothetical protein